MQCIHNTLQTIAGDIVPDCDIAVLTLQRTYNVQERHAPSCGVRSCRCYICVWILFVQRIEVSATAKWWKRQEIKAWKWQLVYTASRYRWWCCNSRALVKCELADRSTGNLRTKKLRTARQTFGSSIVTDWLSDARGAFITEAACCRVQLISELRSIKRLLWKPATSLQSNWDCGPRFCSVGGSRLSLTQLNYPVNWLIS